jgi:hypothetical protein
MDGFEFVSKAHQDLYASLLGQQLWRFMNEPISIKCMQVATYLGKPALLGIEEDLLAKFGVQERGQVTEADKRQYDRLKQMLGQMARQVMEHNGYKHKASNVKTPNSRIFYSASLYER